LAKDKETNEDIEDTYDNELEDELLA